MPPPGGMPMANGPPSGGMMRPPGMPGPMGPAGAAPMPGYNPQQAAAGMQQMSLGGPPGPPVGANRQADIARGWRAAQQLQLCRQLGIAVSVCSNRCAACNCWQWSHENSAGTSIRRYMVESSAITCVSCKLVAVTVAAGPRSLPTATAVDAAACAAVYYSSLSNDCCCAALPCPIVQAGLGGPPPPPAGLAGGPRPVSGGFGGPPRPMGPPSAGAPGGLQEEPARLRTCRTQLQDVIERTAVATSDLLCISCA